MIMPINPNKPAQQSTYYTGPIIGIEAVDQDPPAETGPGWTLGGFSAAELPDLPQEPIDQPFPWLVLALGLAGVYLWKKS